MAYFLRSNQVTEYYDTGGLLHGGTGAMTKNGMLKPTGFAFEFLNRLYPYYIGKGEHILITTDQHDSYGIISYQVKMYRINEHSGSLLNIWKEMDYESELSRNNIKFSSG